MVGVIAGRESTAAVALVCLGVTLLLITLAAVDGIRGDRTWREWWDSLR